MNYIVDIQKAIDYIEDNLEEDLHYETIAKQVGMSSFYFHRMFSAVVGMSPAEYIRNRRLTCAADKLSRSHANILDVAIQYQFGSNESFTRAFTKFHGISPKMAKLEGTKLKSFAKINLSLVVEGGNIMDYRIEKRESFTIAMVVREFDLETSKEEIPKFWTELKRNGILETLSKDYTKKTLGVCLDANNSKKFRYGIGVELEKKEQILMEKLETMEVPESAWAVFPCKGQDPRDIDELWKRIYKEYFITSEYQQSMDLDFELYDNQNVEIWIPIAKE